MKKPYFWKPEEVNFLKAHHEYPRKEIAQHLGKSELAVRIKVWRLGLLKRRFWTVDEEKELKTLVQKGKTVKQIGEILGRTEISIRRKMIKLNIHFNKDATHLHHQKGIMKAFENGLAKRLVIAQAKFWGSKDSKKARLERSERTKILHQNPEWERKRIEGIRKSEKFRTAASKRMRIIANDPRNHKKVSKSIMNNLVERKRRSERRTLRNKDPEFLRKCRQRIRPTKPEKKLNLILNGLFPNEYKYVGNGDVILGGLNPDFVNINGKKKIIEFYGCYWHGCLKCKLGNSKIIDKQRLDIYESYGYKTLIIWGHEFEDLCKLVEKLMEFHFKGSKK